MTDSIPTLKKFNMGQTLVSPIILIIGQEPENNSAVVLDYLDQHSASRVYVISNDPTYQTHISPHYIYREYASEVFFHVLETQKHICHTCHTFKTTQDDKHLLFDPYTYLILDTPSNTDDLCKNKDLKWIFMNGRCARLTFIWTIQQYKPLPVPLPVFIDYIFIGQQDKNVNLHDIHKIYGSMFPCFESFQKIYDQYTKDHGYLVIDNATCSDKLEDQIFWYSKENI